MSCARSLVRTFATQTKQVQNISKSPPRIAIKRFSSGSPSAGGSPLALLERKDQGCKPGVPLVVYILVQVNFNHLRFHSKQIYLKENVPTRSTECASRKSVQDALASRMIKLTDMNEYVGGFGEIWNTLNPLHFLSNK